LAAPQLRLRFIGEVETNDRAMFYSSAKAPFEIEDETMTSSRASLTSIERSSRYSPAEWETRVQLAACYRLVARYRMTDLIYTHISARVPGLKDQFLLNPYGLMFEEVTASNLVKIDLDGRLLEDNGYGVNDAGFTIHSAIHAARHDVACVLHTHTRAGFAVSCQKQGLLPLNQMALQFHGRLAYHDYEGIALDHDERPRLVHSLGGRHAMILRNHGLLTAGRTIPEAFSLMFYLERACEIQIAALAGGGELIFPSPEVCEKTARQHEMDDKPLGDLEWAAHIRALDREDSSYRN
jgi:ribulose-5-phosphate 4-epimerase/fuculose-1-phosphate aldolase